ncbi:MAG: hypothetical protein U9R25_07260 [Chloroflexota bacterium]|nr:hypothetical protein [Chloroflexota bacterium]
MLLPTVADIALLILIIHGLILLAVPIVLFYFLARGMIVVNQKTREVIPLVQDYSRQMADSADNISEKITSPIIKVDQTVSRFRGSLDRAAEPLRGNKEEEAMAESNLGQAEPSTSEVS